MRVVSLGLGRFSREGRATMLVTALTIVSYGVALLRERANAAAFGTSREIDAYLVASGVIALLAITPSRALYEGLVLSIAPATSSARDEASAVSRAALGVGTLVLAAGSGVSLLLTGVLVRAAAPDLPPDGIATAEAIASALIPSIVALGLWEISRGILHGYREFVGSSLLQIVAPLVTFGMVTATSERLGIVSLVMGSVAGAGLQAALALVVVARQGVPFSVSRSLLDLSRLRALGGPLVASGTLVGLAMLWVAADRFLGSSLPEGRIAALNYAARISDVVGVVALTGIATVAFPDLARSARSASASEFSRLLRRSVAATAAAALLLTIAFALFAQPIVHVLLGAGRFDAESERVTTEALLAYLAFLPLTTPAAVIARSVFALGMLRFLVAQSALVVAIKVILGLMLRGPYEHVGVAAASGLATIVGSLLVLIGTTRAARAMARSPIAETQPVTELPS